MAMLSNVDSVDTSVGLTWPDSNSGVMTNLELLERSEVFPFSPSMEQATDGAETAAIDGLVSS